MNPNGKCETCGGMWGEHFGNCPNRPMSFARGYYLWWAGAVVALMVALTGCSAGSAPVSAPPTTWSSANVETPHAVPMAGTAPSNVDRSAVPEIMRVTLPRLASVDDATLLGIGDSTCSAWARGADPRAMLAAGVASGFTPLESHTIMSTLTGLLCPQYNADVTYDATGFHPYN